MVMSRTWHRSLMVLPLAAVVAAGCSSEPSPPVASTATVPAAPSTASPNPVVAENELPGDPSWKDGVRNATDDTAMSGYADVSAVTPGDPVTLFVSTTSPSYRVSAYRMGWYDGAGARKVWTSDREAGTEQTEQGFIAQTQTHYAKWKPSLTVDTAGWTPGMYLLRLTGSSGAEWFVPLVVRAPSAEGQVVLVMSDLTWQAYNLWGSRSAYEGPGGFPDRSRVVSFSRPYLNGSGTGKYLGYEQPVVALAERLGIPVTYVAASDLADGDPEWLAGAEGVLSLGHNEYWTVEQRRAVAQARDDGSDLGFLGANTMYWRVRVDRDGPQGMLSEIIYKDSGEDPVQGADTTDRFREGNAAAERSLIGMDYECYPATGTYTVTDPDFFLFRGANTDRTYGGLVTIEVDRAYPLPGTPDNLQIVANSPTDCDGTPTVSNSTYYSVRSGAGVFAVGTMGWVLKGLRGDAPPATTRFVRRVTTNLLRQMAAGPMGLEHPAVGNLAKFDLPSTNTTGRVEPL